MESAEKERKILQDIANEEFLCSKKGSLRNNKQNDDLTGFNNSNSQLSEIAVDTSKEQRDTDIEINEHSVESTATPKQLHTDNIQASSTPLSQELVVKLVDIRTGQSNNKRLNDSVTDNPSKKSRIASKDGEKNLLC